MRGQIPLDADFFERGAQTVDVDGERVIVHEGIGVPEVLHDGRSRDDLARATQEQRKDTQLVFGELGTVTGCRIGDHGAGEIELQPLVDECAALAGSRGATQQGIDACHEHTGAVGLGNKVVRAERHGHDLVDLGRARGKHDDGDLGFATDLVADMLAVLDGKREVEQHQVGRGSKDIARDMFERFAGLDLKTGTGKDVGKFATDRLVVLNDID